MSGDVRIGISGWTYAPWRGTFFPEDVPQRAELAYASRQLRTIEINGTFYSLQRPESYAFWREQTPGDFVFSVKAPRFITHIKRLKDARPPLANFFASGVLRLGPKLGPVLWQLPPSFRYDAERLRAFFALLPRTTGEAARLARAHDFRVSGRSWLKAEGDEPIRHALEIRHESFRNPEFYSLLREAGVALVTADTAGKWPLLEEQTANFSYARLHGDEKLYVSGYTPEALKSWAAKIKRWSRGGRDVFVYFDNDVKVRAPYDAMSLAYLLGVGPKPEGEPPDPESIPDLPPVLGSDRWPFFRRRAERRTANHEGAKTRRTAGRRRRPARRAAASGVRRANPALSKR